MKRLCYFLSVFVVSIGLFFFGLQRIKERKNPFVTYVNYPSTKPVEAPATKWYIYGEGNPIEGYQNFSLETLFEKDSLFLRTDSFAHQIILHEVLHSISPENLVSFLRKLQEKLAVEGVLEIREEDPMTKWKALEEEPSLEKRYERLKSFFSKTTFWEEKDLKKVLALFGFEIEKKQGKILAKKKQILREQALDIRAQEAETALFCSNPREKDPFTLFLEKNKKRNWHFSEVFARVEPLYQKSKASKEEAHHHQQRQKKRWIAFQLAKTDSSSKILYLSKEEGPYESLFMQKNYQRQSLEDAWEENLKREQFDHIFCMDCLIYMAEPALFLQKVSRFLAPGGKLYLSAPLSSGVLEVNTHFFGGFAPAWYNHFLPLAGLCVEEIQPCGGFFQHLAQECARVAWTFEEHAHLHGKEAALVKELFEEILPSYLYDLDPKVKMEAFTEGYFVIAEKKPFLDERASNKVMK